MSSNVQIDQVLAQMRVLAAQAQGGAQATGAAESGAPDQVSFQQVLRQSLDAVNGQQQEAARLTEAFQHGDPGVDVVELMTSLEKASLSFEAMNAARERLLSAYREIMNMSV
jgi:flagellar hook-basal body complex protein FliE